MNFIFWKKFMGLVVSGELLVVSGGFWLLVRY
jgi:hypothetical protein